MIYFKILLISLILLPSCSKVKDNPDYNQMIGKWVNVNGDEPTTVEFFTNGKVLIQRSTERGVIFKIEHIEKREFLYLNWWQNYTCTNSALLKSDKKLDFMLNPTNDTARILVGARIEDFVLNHEHWVYYIKE